MKAWSTKLQEYINQKLTDCLGFPKNTTPAKYKAYCKIRLRVSKYLGVSRPLGIIEYYKAVAFVDKLLMEDTNEGNTDN